MHGKTVNVVNCIKSNDFLLSEAGPLATGSGGVPLRPRHHTAQVPPVFLWREDSGLKMQEDLTGLERVGDKSGGFSPDKSPKFQSPEM